MNDYLEDIPRNAAGHFQLWFYAAALRLVTQLEQGVGDDALDQFAFLAGYISEIDRRMGGQQHRSPSAWEERIMAWETAIPGHLPLRALRDAAGCGRCGLLLLMCVGLAEEDSRFSATFAALQGDPSLRRPTFGLLSSLWSGIPQLGDARAILRGLIDHGLLHVSNPGAPRAEWMLHPANGLWECIQGEQPQQPTPWAEYRPPEGLAALSDLIIHPDIRTELCGLPPLLERGVIPAIVVRGPQHNGRRTLIGALARSLDRGLLMLNAAGDTADSRWQQLGTLSVVLNTLPVIIVDAAPGEVIEIPALSPYRGPLAIVTGIHGGLRGPAVERALSLTLEIPDARLRQEHWQIALGAQLEPSTLSELSQQLRTTGGNIRRVAASARAIAALDGRDIVQTTDVRRAAHTLGRQTLDTLAILVPHGGEMDTFAANPETTRELHLLETHCRHRERLSGTLGTAFGDRRACGVRALFSGPSGSGKTLAARRLAARLERDLYRIDLSAVVNKYIGETEKNLGRVLARAEELDVVLLLDEGDSLMSRRTSVHNANDRYANLETNYLLQRMETFEGILIITTNAAQRIDDAFQRRMDVVIAFGLPDAQERLAIWNGHLPAQHGVPLEILEEVALCCGLSGGQIRNAAHHAGLLALDTGQSLRTAHLEDAVRREYRKSGAICPLPGRLG